MDTKRNDRIEEVLNSLDGSKRAAAPDFFYTRLKAKMQARLEGGEKNRPHWQLRPAYILSALLLVISINVFVFFKGQENETVTADTNESVQQSFAAEYSLNDNTVYDLNQDK